jgi:hypothetical protein
MTITLNSKVVAKLSVQADGEEFTVGDPVSGTFIRVPYEAVHIIQMLDGVRTLHEVSEQLRQEHMDADVLDFVESLHELELIYSIDGKVFLTLPVESPTNRALSSAASVIFHPVSQVFYLLFFAVSIGLITAVPDLRPVYTDFWAADATGLSLLLLFVFSWPLTIIHEAGHYLAAIRLGIPVTFKLSLRFYWLVVEADMTGLWSVSKKKRYLPYAAGMAFDSVILLGSLAGQMAASGFTLKLLKMITLVLIMRFGWQLLIFLRTDIYFLIMNKLNMPSLHGYAKEIIKGYAGKKESKESAEENLSAKERTYVKGFASCYLIGVLIAAGLLFFFSLPGLYVLLSETIAQLESYSSSSWQFWDGIITLAVLAVNAAIWTIGAVNKYKSSNLERIPISSNEAS